MYSYAIHSCTTGLECMWSTYDAVVHEKHNSVTRVVNNWPPEPRAVTQQRPLYVLLRRHAHRKACVHPRLYAPMQLRVI